VLIHRGKVVLEGSLDQVRGASGKKALYIDFDGDGAFLNTLPQVRTASIDSNTAELTLADGADPQQVLREAVGRLRIRRFELAVPSLEQIFIEKVGEETLSEEVAR
jgi:ABC-2 type transport system ATP-binding protein